MSPSSLIFYLGLDSEVPGLLHHNLFFDESLDKHAAQIYDHPSWPDKPLFYVCAPSKTDPEVAPKGCENLFILMPLAPGIQDDELTREKYFGMFADRIQERTGTDIRKHVLVKRSYAISDFEKDYHSFKGNAYGLANTLMQTAVLKPKMISPKVRNLFFTGQLTVPGPGVPPAIISGRMAAGLVAERFPITRKAITYV
jgi:phytoene desaturase